MFLLGFKNSADMDLLSAIAITNGGVSETLLQGHDDFASQMESFQESEFGTVVSSDVRVELEGDVSVSGATQQDLPLLADGYETIVRGLFESQNDNPVQAVTTASTQKGSIRWPTTSVKVSRNETCGSSLCFQSYAHSRITQLLRLHNAAKLVEDDILKELASLSKPCKTEQVDCIKEEALSLALEAKVVAKGLTGMVTVDDEKCLSFEEETEICRDGTTKDGKRPGGGSSGNGHEGTVGSRGQDGRVHAGSASNDRQSRFCNAIIATLLVSFWFCFV
mmetsp:Transcript_526/g.1614  ORF Transcript_526/g.1614 Transcript_526/m.1614 type:complete len:278 (-) Transcript_526:114-947(-)